MPVNDNYGDPELLEALAILRQNRADWLAYRPTNELSRARRARMLREIDELEREFLANLDV